MKMLYKLAIKQLQQYKMNRRTKRYMKFKSLQFKFVYNYEDSDAE